MSDRVTSLDTDFPKFNQGEKMEPLKLVMLIEGTMEDDQFEVIQIDDQDPAEVIRQIRNWAGNAEEGQKFEVRFDSYTARQCAEANINGEYWGGHFGEDEYNRRMAEAAKL